MVEPIALEMRLDGEKVTASTRIYEIDGDNAND